MAESSSRLAEDARSGLEKRLDDLAQGLKESGRRLTGLRRRFSTATKAADEGDLRALRRHMGEIVVDTQALLDNVDRFSRAYTLTESEEAEYLRSRYSEDLIGAAALKGIVLIQTDERLVSFPSTLRIVAKDCLLEFNGRRLRGLRPTRVVERLAEAQLATRAFDAQAFADLLFETHRLLTSNPFDPPKNALDRIYHLLTLLPQAASAYSRDDFYADVHRLATSDVGQTSQGVRIELPPGSSGLRDHGAIVHTETGDTRTYFQITFQEATHA